MPGQHSDGHICRQILLHTDNPIEADKWMAKLKSGKQRHIRMLMGQAEIWRAMRRVARFPGLWEDIQIGNFAKHLAAHCDDAIVCYWRHIDRIWSIIFHGLETQIPILDAGTVRILQYKTPKRSKKDLDHIHKLLQSKHLFPNIYNEDQRAMLYRNISTPDVILPSILTFHENMRFITIGTKILENYVLPPIKISRKSIPSCPNSGNTIFARDSKDLLKRLKKDSTRDTYRNSMSILSSFVALLLIALGNFPFLGSEAPLQDIRGKAMIAAPSNKHIAQLCHAASSYGFHNQKITQGALLSSFEALPTNTESPSHILAQWRGGKPTIETFQELQGKSSVDHLCKSTSLVGSPPTWVLNDILSAFFGDSWKSYALGHNSPRNQDVARANNVFHFGDRQGTMTEFGFAQPIGDSATETQASAKRKQQAERLLQSWEGVQIRSTATEEPRHKRPRTGIWAVFGDAKNTLVEPPGSDVPENMDASRVGANSSARMPPSPSTANPAIDPFDLLPSFYRSQRSEGSGLEETMPIIPQRRSIISIPTSDNIQVSENVSTPPITASSSAVPPRIPLMVNPPPTTHQLPSMETSGFHINENMRVHSSLDMDNEPILPQVHQEGRRTPPVEDDYDMVL